jgi:hypothetical protein
LQNSKNFKISFCRFLNNSAKIGGAIYYGFESHIDVLPLFINNYFHENIADEMGGGISLSLKEAKIQFDEVFQENSFINNQAIYGPNYASYPVNMKAEIFDKSNNKPMSSNKFDDSLIKLSIFSGIKFQFLIRITLEDHFGQNVSLNFTP